MLIEEIKCCGCSACYSSCGFSAIEMKLDENGFYKPFINYKKCLKCRKCEKICPVINKNFYGTSSKIPSSFLIINKNDNERKISSSGGVFFALAHEIIQQGGVVFGAIFNDKWKVIHSYIESETEIERVSRSKYVQSYIGNSYIEAKQFLETGRKVLFCGTSCQISGLKQFLSKDYENLLCVDFICHGIPSVSVWEKYLVYLEKTNKSKIKSLYFRGKNLGWHKHSLHVAFSNGIVYEVDRRDDPYMKLFLRDLTLNDCCYDCGFKTINRIADITLADFWGIEKEFPDYDDNMGTSFVLAHSEKGKTAIDLLNNCVIKNVTLEAGVRHNPSLINSARNNIYRSQFMEDLKNKSFSSLYDKYCKKIIFLKIFNRLSKSWRRK